LSNDRWALGLSTFAIALSFILAVDPDGSRARFAGTALPPSCPTKVLFDTDCPGCGLSRSFIALSHGEATAAFLLNPAGPYLYLLAWLQIPYRIWVLRRRVPVDKRPQALRWAGNLAIAALFGSWIAKLWLGMI